MADLIVVGRLGRGHLHRHLRPSCSEGEVRVDLSQMSFCEPLGLVAAISFADRCAEDADVRVIAPREDHVANYLARMRLGDLLDGSGIAHDLPRVSAQDRRGVLVELTSFRDAGDVERLADLVHGSVEPFAPAVAKTLHECVCEIGENVPAHARRPHGFLAAQKVNGGSQLLFAVADAGIGVHETLRASGAVDAVTALRMAIQPGITEDSGPRSGSGLPEVVSALEKVGGLLHMASAKAGLTVSQGRTRTTRAENPWSGTCVQAELASAPPPVAR